MRKSLTAACLIAVLALAAGPGIAGARESPETVVFELSYRALTSPRDALSYSSYWGFGSSPPTDVAFVEAVKERVQEYDLVYNPVLPEPHRWSVVELREKKPVALYFDLDADGNVSDSERIPPTTTSREQSGSYEFTFITPDFVMRQEDGRDIPFRVMVVADTFGGDQMNYMWSPSCILEGQATLAGEPMRLFLYGDGFSGSFNAFGRCQFALVPAGQKLEGYLPRNMLSSLICHEGTFYKLALDGSHEKDKTIQLRLRKDTSPTDRVAVSLKGKETLRTRLQGATITGANDDTIWFRTENLGAPLPIGQYTLSSGYVLYGRESDDEWQVTFGAGPGFAIAKDETAAMDLGEPALAISAIEEQQRYRSDAKEQSTYAGGTSIYLTPQIKGKAGEVYLRFSQKSLSGNQWSDVKPHITILDADGKEVASADMEYG